MNPILFFPLSAALGGLAALDQPPAPVLGPPAITHTRPAWMDGGILIAGNWSSLPHRKERFAAPWNQMGYKLTDEEADAASLLEMTPEMADRLKEYGVTMAVVYLFSGLGPLAEEMPGMEEVKRFATLLHTRGIRIGVYIHCASFSYSFLKSMPEAHDWLAWPDFKDDLRGIQPPDPAGRPPRYGVYRNHPQYLAFMRERVKYAVEEVKADLLHFDNWVNESGWSPWAVEDFKSYLRLKYSPEKLKDLFGDDKLEHVAQDAKDKKTPAAQEWQYFQGWMLAQAYRHLCEYARGLRPDIAIDANTSGFNVHYCRPVDMSLVLPFGDSFWHEQAAQGWDAQKGLLNTSIRTYKVARLFNQAKFCYTPTRVSNTEALAFNDDCQGCLYWFQYGRLTGPPWEPWAFKPADKRLMPETEFYLKRRDLFVGGQTLADVAVLRGRATNIVGPEEAVQNGYLFEQAMITQHVPFEIIFDQHLADLRKYKVVALPDARLLADEQIDLLIRYVEGGGALLLTGQTAAMDPWGRPRAKGLERFLRGPVTMGAGAHVESRGRGRIVYATIRRPEVFEEGSLPLNGAELAQAAAAAAGEAPRVTTTAPPHVCMEFVRHPGRLLVNMVDFAEDPKSAPFEISLAPALGRVKKAALLSPRAKDIPLTVKNENGRATITIPTLDVYAVAAIELEDAK